MIIRNGSIPAKRRLFTQASIPPLVLCSKNNYQELSRDLGTLAEIVTLGDNTVSPRDVVAFLKKQGFVNVLLEGGPRLNHAFFTDDLVDRINLTIVPFLIGQNTLPAIVDGELPFSDFAGTKWRLVSSTNIEDEIFLVYEK